jgi:phage-related minor tail protein
MDSISGHIENAFMAMVDGSMSVEDAFKAMLRNIILDIYRQQVVKPFVSAIMGLFANGGAFIGGNQVKAFADGGVVGSPTYFPMSGGRTGLMGEAGPEAIMPLKRGSNGKLGVQMNGGGQVIVNQSINISTGVQQTVRNEIKSMMPQIAEQSKAAVLDAKRRGGSYGGKF